MICNCKLHPLLLSVVKYCLQHYLNQEVERFLYPYIRSCTWITLHVMYTNYTSKNIAVKIMKEDAFTCCKNCHFQNERVWWLEIGVLYVHHFSVFFFVFLGMFSSRIVIDSGL